MGKVYLIIEIKVPKLKDLNKNGVDGSKQAADDLISY